MNLKAITWKSESVPDEENLLLEEDDKKIVATSHVTGGDEYLHTKWDAAYRIVCDKNWHVREVSIQENTSDRRLGIYTDGQGHWKDVDGKEIKSIQGCIDVDFRATPFSNTLPIRRLQLAVGEIATIEVAYINAPDLALSKERQIYTRISQYEWKFEQPSADFEAIITVDDNGLVVKYPGLFTRTTAAS